MTANMNEHDNELLTNSGVDFKQLCLERAATHAGNIKIKRNNFFNPFFVSCNRWGRC